MNTDPPTQDDINITITWYDGGGPYKCIEAWNGVNWTPLAVVMSSGSMFCHVPSHSPFEWSRELDSFETAKRAWDDFNLTITWYDGGGPYQVLHAWNGAKRTPLAVVMSGSMFCHVPSHSPFEWSRELDSFETAKRALDDFNLTITWYDGGGPYQVLHAWNGAKRTPLAVVMSGSMFCMAHRYTFFKEKRGFSLCITRRPKHNLERSGAHPRIDNWNSEGSREYKIQHVER